MHDVLCESFQAVAMGGQESNVFTDYIMKVHDLKVKSIMKIFQTQKTNGRTCYPWSYSFIQFHYADLRAGYLC